jgi:hypothetical protein
MNTQSSAVDIPPQTIEKHTHIVASTTPDGRTMLTSIVTDAQGQQVRRNSVPCADTGISPTYYTSNGSMVQTTRQGDDSHIAGSPVYGDQSRIFFSHNTGCSCKFYFSSSV